jgi:hypothetical protein
MVNKIQIGLILFAICILQFASGQPYRLRVDSLRVDYKFYISDTDRFPFFNFLNPSNQLGGDGIADDTIGTSHLKTDIIGPSHIQDDAILETHIDAAAVTNTKIASYAITSSKINPNEIDSSKIINGSIHNDDLENSSLGVSAGSGLSGGGTPNLGESVPLNVTVDDSSIYISDDTLKMRLNSAGGITYNDTTGNLYALDFDDASSEYASKNVSAYTDQQGFFSFWVVVDDLSSVHVSAAFARTDVPDIRYVRIDTDTNGKVRISQNNNDTSDQVATPSSTVTAGSIHHLVCGSSGSAFLIWVDGNSQSLVVNSGSNNGDWLGDVTQTGTDQAWTLGVLRTSTFYGYYDGKIDEVSYFNITPTQAIVDSIYNSGQPKNISAMTGLQHYWRLEDGSGQSATDSKGSIDLTLGADAGAAADDPTWIASTFGWENLGLQLSYDNTFFEINGSNQLTVKDSAITNVKLADSSFDLNTGGGLAGGDTISLGGNDSIYIADSGVTTAKIADSAVTWAKLSAILRANIGGNLYDYQDATINTNLQMPVRFAHYLFEKYYSESDYYYHFDYDGSGTEFKKTRRPLIAYMDLLVALHKETDRAIYWTRLTDIAALLLTDMTTINHAVTGGRSCKTIRVEETSPSVYWDAWSYADCHFFSNLYYIYTENTTAYASYLTEVKNFIDVSRSYITKSGIEGWGFNYYWDTGSADNSTTRINVNGSWLPFWAEMKANNITTTDITTTASYDSLLDSTYAYIMSAWEVESWLGGDILTGGWGLFVNSSSIARGYNPTLFIDMCRTSEILNDWTSWAEAGLKDSLGKVLNYHFTDATTNFLTMQWPQSIGLALMAKWAQSETISFTDTLGSQRVADGFVSNIKNPPPFSGDNWLIAATPRFNVDRLGKWCAELINYFNDNSFAETYAYPYVFRSNWNNNIGGYNNDGNYTLEQYESGFLNSSAGIRIGYRHGDSTPATDTTGFTISGNILSYSAPNSGTMSNGLSYAVTKRMGSPYKKIIPSAADSIWFRVNDTGDNNGDSTYFFYYTTGGVLDTMRNTETAVGDSFQIDGTKGIFSNIARVANPAAGSFFTGFICNKTSLWMVARSEDATYKKYVPSVTTLPDSAIFFFYDAESDNFMLHDASDWTDALLYATDILENVQGVWNNGLTYDGILEDKTQ